MLTGNGDMKKFMIFFLAIFAANQSVALTSEWHPIVAVGGGMANTINLGKSTVFPITNPNQDEYYSYSPTEQGQTQGLFEGFLGVEHPLVEQWLLQAGCAYTQSGNFRSEGSLLQGVDTQSQNSYRYQFNVTTRQVMLQTKWMRLVHQRFYPYALIGLGAAINTASDYATNVPYTLSYTRLYTDKTSTTFAYRVGVGLDVDLGNHIRLGIAYRITDLGGASLGNATIAQSAVYGSLSQSAIYANEALAQLTYRF